MNEQDRKWRVQRRWNNINNTTATARVRRSWEPHQTKQGESWVRTLQHLPRTSGRSLALCLSPLPTFLPSFFLSLTHSLVFPVSNPIWARLELSPDLSPLLRRVGLFLGQTHLRLEKALKLWFVIQSYFQRDSMGRPGMNLVCNWVTISLKCIQEIERFPRGKKGSVQKLNKTWFPLLACRRPCDMFSIVGYVCWGDLVEVDLEHDPNLTPLIVLPVSTQSQHHHMGVPTSRTSSTFIGLDTILATSLPLPKKEGSHFRTLLRFAYFLLALSLLLSRTLLGWVSLSGSLSAIFAIWGKEVQEKKLLLHPFNGPWRDTWTWKLYKPLRDVWGSTNWVVHTKHKPPFAQLFQEKAEFEGWIWSVVRVNGRRAPFKSCWRSSFKRGSS